MERISEQKSRGLNAAAVRTWGMVFVAMGVLGKAIVENRLLRMGSVSSGQLLEMLQQSSSAMMLATVALVLEAVETCAVPIFAFLLCEGAGKTSDFKKYLLRVAGVALLSEVPFDLVCFGKPLAMSLQNPVIGCLIALVMLWFYRRYSRRWGVKILVTLAAILWSVMLSVDHGPALILLVAVLWALRNKPLLRGVAGAMAALACSLSSMFYMASPMGLMPVHFYNGEKGPDNRLVNYLAYPVVLIASWAAGVLLF